ncbi:hypothetical protein GIY21_00995 [Xanthomonas sontii]|uniref:Uncharacterized protein n=1 Tax=Xanthomonas sontii TaxID=2650745 RepID=A0A6N7Q9C1_9XANT|nr:hypothetical protein [Xanthomonas sontii]MRG98864.1 hypothetical protein [Xanthomonas sontii]MRH73345.1 hypothetical protein [Xanthomonas sontii]
MAKNKAASTPVKGAAQGEAVDQAATAGEVSEAPEGEGEGDQAEIDTDGDQESDAPAPAGEAVRALVLHSCHLGEVGKVIDVPAEHAEALELDGYIDTHPAALKYQG